jgi:hypothetical protein
MTSLVAIRRVTVIADVVLEKTLLESFTRLGAQGYTIMECRGKGHHTVIPDPYTGQALVRIELLVQPKVADAIFDYLHREVFENYACAACIETVDVAPGDRF